MVRRLRQHRGAWKQPPEYGEEIIQGKKLESQSRCGTGRTDSTELEHIPVPAGPMPWQRSRSHANRFLQAEALLLPTSLDTLCTHSEGPI